MRILIITPIELTRDVRVRRQVAAAIAGGHEPVGLCGRGSDDAELPLPGVTVVRVSAGRLSRRLRRYGLGGPQRSGPLMRELRGMYRLLRLALTTLRLARAGSHLGAFDVVHANEFDALPAGRLLAMRYGARFVYDTDELYMFLEEDPPRLYRALAGRLESALARKADAVVTNCSPYAEFLTGWFRLRRPALVVLNAPECRGDVPAPTVGEGPLRAVYQAGPDQPSRPVSDIVLAAELAPNLDVTIRVVEFDRDAIERMIIERGLADRVHVVAPVPETELVDALMPFEVGIILLRPLNLDSELSQPNKLFEYMMAGLAVVAPCLPGMTPIVEGERVGLSYAADQPGELAAALERLAGDRAQLLEMRLRARAVAMQRFHADTQRPVLGRAWEANAD